ncbi:glycoside hydrolase family 15 protein [Taklimakanibacter deserti]|uniref:glycoside hydrolase family 15 protein n=1 Tax=Taklimakanibacter deserti TaxID=2267839 RepID=UPI000E64FDF8
MPDTLDTWIDRQYGLSAKAMLTAVSAVGIVKTRPGFGQTVRPRPGSIVASPVLASWDPDPDYFFHWFRDSAIVIDALRVLHQDGPIGPEALTHFRDFIDFSLSLRRLEGKPLVEDKSWRSRTTAQFQQYLRSDEELAAVTPDTVVAETRVNPDATLDISRWSRPQHDGPALRILVVLRWLGGGIALDDDCRRSAALLLHGDIDFILAHWDEPDFDMWEEEKGENYYTDRLSASALEQAALWLDRQARNEDRRKAAACRHAASHIRRRLDDYWLESEGFYRSRLSGTPSKYLDISVIFAIIHSGEDGASHGLRDARVLATLAKLEALFAKDYAINHGRPEERAPALGRYSGDVYFSGGAYYFSTLAAAEFYYRLAAVLHDRTYRARGDAFLETVRAYTPENGELSEQFDRVTGRQTSAKNLAWSHAGLITAVAARRALGA